MPTLGYDDRNLYVVFIAFDDEPDRVRAHMARRENVFGDDIVEIQLDTFLDEQRAFSFIVNPLGIQLDALWTEGRGLRLLVGHRVAIAGAIDRSGLRRVDLRFRSVASAFPPGRIRRGGSSSCVTCNGRTRKRSGRR